MILAVLGGLIGLGTLTALGLARACKAGDEAIVQCWDWSEWEEELSER